MRGDWDGVDRRNRQQWRLKKEISLGDVVAITIACGAIIAGWFTLDKRVTQLEVANIVQEKRDGEQDAQRRDAVRRVENQLDRLNDKLDRLLTVLGKLK